MKKVIVGILAMCVIGIAVEGCWADCDRCLAIVHGSNQAHQGLFMQAMNCAWEVRGECVAAVSNLIFEKFGVIVDFRPRY